MTVGAGARIDSALFYDVIVLIFSSFFIPIPNFRKEAHIYRAAKPPCRRKAKLLTHPGHLLEY